MMMRPSEKGTHNVSTLGGKSEIQTAFQFATYGFWETPCIRRGFCL